jgi:hypothetical protein
MVKCIHCDNGKLPPIGTMAQKIQMSQCVYDNKHRTSNKERVCPHGKGWIQVQCPKDYKIISYRPDNLHPPQYCDRCGSKLTKNVKDVLKLC